LQSPREGAPPPYPSPVGPPMSPRQFHPPPSNLQKRDIYRFEHGSFTKFPGTSAPQWALTPRPATDFAPPGLSARAHGQPQLAPKPAPDPAQEMKSKLYAMTQSWAAPQLHAQIRPAEPSRDAMSPRPPSQGGPPQQFHSGFRPINETQRPGGPIPVAPKPPQQQPERQEGGRQLAPKPAPSVTGPYSP
jgi:hypothetical protein